MKLDPEHPTDEALCHSGVVGDTGPTPQSQPRHDPDRLAELEEEKAFLLRSLDDLERERDAGDLDEHDYAELRDGYTARAAKVLRELDAGRAALPARAPVRWGRAAAIAGLVAVVAVGAGVAVAAFSGQRLPGETVSGDIAETAGSRLAEARALEATDVQGAIDAYDAVLAVDPDNVEALTYRGWLVARVGSTAEAPDLVDRGEAFLDRAIAADPGYADPYCFKAVIQLRYRGDAAAAKDPVEVCLAANPPQEVRGLVEALRADIDAALAGGTTPAPGYNHTVTVAPPPSRATPSREAHVWWAARAVGAA